MSPENTRRLYAAFPRLYAGRNRSITESMMPFGFECDDGWFDLVWRLSEKLEPLGVEAMQVKEKYGALCFYVGSAPHEAFDLIDAAEAESTRTCERCGAVGKTRDAGWIWTLCDVCWAKKLEEDRNEAEDYE